MQDYRPFIHDRYFKCVSLRSLIWTWIQSSMPFLVLKWPITHCLNYHCIKEESFGTITSSIWTTIRYEFGERIKGKKNTWSSTLFFLCGCGNELDLKGLYFQPDQLFDKILDGLINAQIIEEDKIYSYLHMANQSKRKRIILFFLILEKMVKQSIVRKSMSGECLQKKHSDIPMLVLYSFKTPQQFAADNFY